jgi:hypothetical protein
MCCNRSRLGAAKFARHQTSAAAWVHPASLSKGFFSGGKNGRIVRLTTHIYQMPLLRMGGTIPPLPLHAFMAYTGTALLSSGQLYSRFGTSLMILRYPVAYPCLVSVLVCFTLSVTSSCLKGPRKTRETVSRGIQCFCRHSNQCACQYKPETVREPSLHLLVLHVF